MPPKIFISVLNILIILLVNASAQNTLVKVPGSENQWPMSGGPDGSWKVQTSGDVPLKWSVRTGENIKWKTALPAGGQSGLAVWGDKLFLTVNKPLETPPYLQSKSLFETSKKKYDRLCKDALVRLEETEDKKFLELITLKKAAAANWQAFLTNNQGYESAPANKKSRVRDELLKSHETGRAYTRISLKLIDYIHENFPEILSTFKAMKAAESAMNLRGNEAEIVLFCLNAENGKVLWSQPVKGVMNSSYNYGFSDSTTPCPVTDGKNVWAINSSGGMACFSMTGELVWERTWMPTGGRPFNKQFDSILYKNLILNVEPPAEGDSTRIKEWNYLHAFDSQTGKRVWVTKDALTHYNTPVIGETADGKPAVLIGRGGPHGVPERPVGLSLISLEQSSAGDVIWQWEPQDENKLSGWGALSTQHWGKEWASWFYAGNDHLTIDTKTGKLISRHILNKVDQYSFDEEQKKYVFKENVELIHLQNQRHCNMSSGDFVFYMVRYEPFIARHNVITGKNEHLEVPREIDGDGHFIWKTAQSNDGLNSRGQMLGEDKRARGDGFQKCFLGSPTMVNNYIFFTNAVGLVYVVDANAEKFNENALVAVNDLGKKGETWSVNSMTFANGRIYHRTMKEVICIGK